MMGFFTNDYFKKNEFFLEKSLIFFCIEAIMATLSVYGLKR